MKMSELRAENESLKQQLALLAEQKEGEKDSPALTQLKEKNRSLRKSIKELKAEKVGHTDKILALENDLSSSEQDNHQLKDDLEKIQQQLTELSNAHKKTTKEVESLRAEQVALREKESQLKALRPELDRLRQVDTICKEKTAQVEALQVEVAQQGQHLADARAEAARQAADHQNQVTKLNNDMEIMRSQLQAELGVLREQSQAEIASLQAQKSSMSAQITELTEKLKLVAKHLERQLSEKRKLVSQYEKASKDHQAFKARTDKDRDNLMELLRKMAIELDARKAVQPSQENSPGVISSAKPANLGESSSTEKQLLQQIIDLRDQLSTLNEINEEQTHKLTSLSKRMERINSVLATPQGRVFSRLFNIKD